MQSYFSMQSAGLPQLAGRFLSASGATTFAVIQTKASPSELQEVVDFSIHLHDEIARLQPDGFNVCDANATSFCT
jgi:hypothetical protein